MAPRLHRFRQSLVGFSEPDSKFRPVICQQLYGVSVEGAVVPEGELACWQQLAENARGIAYSIADADTASHRQSTENRVFAFGVALFSSDSGHGSAAKARF